MYFTVHTITFLLCEIIYYMNMYQLKMLTFCLDAIVKIKKNSFGGDDLIFTRGLKYDTLVDILYAG